LLDSRLLPSTIFTPAKEENVISLCEIRNDGPGAVGNVPRGTEFRLLDWDENGGQDCHVRHLGTQEKFKAPLAVFRA
jgi:hypothetical protein